MSCSSSSVKEGPLVAVPSDVKVAEPAPVVVTDQEPVTIVNLTIEKEKQKKPTIALIFGPGLNRTVGYSAFLKELKKQNISAQIVSGTGMGAIIAAHYASGKTPQKIEWLFFKFFNETRGKRPFSRSWRRSLENVFLKEFKNTQIQDLKMNLVIPVYQTNPPMIKNFSQGNLFDLLKAQFIFSSNGGGALISPLGIQTFNGFWMRKLGAKIVVGVDVLGKKIIFEEDDKFLKDLYGKIAKQIKNESKDLDLFYTLPFSDMALDSEKKLPESLQKTQDFGKIAAKTIKLKRDLRKSNENEVQIQDQ